MGYIIYAIFIDCYSMQCPSFNRMDSICWRLWVHYHTNQPKVGAKLHVYAYMKKLIIPFPYMLYAYSVKKPIGELNLKRALDEDTGVFSFFFSFLSSSSPLGQTAVSGNSTLHQ